MMIQIFKAGLMDYPEKKNLTKPVRFEERHLREVASAANKANITDEHGGEIIGEMYNFTCTDGILYADDPNVDYQGKGFSPSFEFGLIDRGEYYEPYGIKLLDVALTDNPKSHIFYNSIKGDVTLDLKEKEELLNTIKDNQKRIREQEQEIGILKNKNKSLETTLSDKNESDKLLKEKEKELAKLKEDYEKIENKAKSFDDMINAEKDKLIEEIANGSEEIKERLEKMSLDDIKFLNEKKLLNTDPKGVGAQAAPGLQDGSHHRENDDDKPATYEDYQKWKKENNVR